MAKNKQLKKKPQAKKKIVAKKRVRAAKKKAIGKKKVRAAKKKAAPTQPPQPTSGALPPSIEPSDLIQVVEDQLGDALANLRREIRNANSAEDLDKLLEQRKEINERLNAIVDLQLKIIDADPLITASITELGVLTLEIQRAVRKIQTVKRGIENATKIIGYADEILKIVSKLPV